MRLQELLTELKDSPSQFLTHCEGDVCEFSSEELGLSLYLSRGLSHKLDSDTVFIEFAVHGRYDLTGTGNAFKILSTVSTMLETGLRKFVKPTDMFVEFASEKREPSRVKLYQRSAPMITNILGYGWKRDDRKSSGSLYVFSWERNKTPLSEKAVLSSWITNLTYNRPNRTLTMRLSNGRAYSIVGVTRSMFERWTNSPSKGQFFHNNIDGGYLITRIK